MDTNQALTNSQNTTEKDPLIEMIMTEIHMFINNSSLQLRGAFCFFFFCFSYACGHQLLVLYTILMCSDQNLFFATFFF